MPKKYRAKAKKEAKYNAIDEKITIYDSADSQKRNRWKINAGNQANVLHKCIPIITAQINDPSPEAHSDHACNVPETNTAAVIIEQYNDYCVDVWQLISRFIRPEDVGRFALICRKTYAITRTDQFWLHMYKKFYHPFAALTDDLLPTVIRKTGIRQAAIRLMYMNYAPFRARPRCHDGDKVLKHQLVKTWRTCAWPDDKHMIYYFKFKEIAFDRELSDDNENHIGMVMISTLNVPLPSHLVGLALVDYKRFTAPSGLARLELKFTQRCYVNTKTAKCLTFSLDAVSRVNVWHWWHESFASFRAKA